MTIRKSLITVILTLVLCLAVGSAMAAPVANDAELLAAVAAANSATAGPVTIKLADNTTFTADITIKQINGIDVIIEGGNNSVYTGTISIDGRNEYTTERITIKGIAFVAAPGTTSGYDFINFTKGASNGRTTYPHNVTVENCSFTGDYQHDIVAVRLNSASNVVIRDCNAVGVHSLMQGTGNLPKNGATYAVQIIGCTVNTLEGGVNLGSSAPVLIEDCDITAEDYAVRSNISEQTAAERTLTIQDSTLNAATPVVLRNVTDPADITLNVEDNTMIHNNPDNSWLAVKNSANVTTEDMLNTNDLKNVAAENNVLSYNEYVASIAGPVYSAPHTGDNSHVLLWAGLMFVSVLGMVTFAKKRVAER